MVRPRFDWLVYNEPEDHLDELVERLTRLSESTSQMRIVGLTYKDDTTLARFNRLGYLDTYRYDPARDLGMTDRCAGLETLQLVLATSIAPKLVATHKSANLLIVRHILEHAHNPVAMLKTLGQLITPNGHIVIEVPDCTKFIGACDYSFVWEEHITYFSSETLMALVECAGLVVHDIFTHSYPFENSLIVVVGNNAPRSATRRETRNIRSQLRAGEVFSEHYSEVREHLQARLLAWRQEGKRIAIFGAGHLAARFINIYSISEHIDCVIDDHPRKRGMLMPGSRVPIRDSSALEDADVCLLSLNPDSERRVVAMHKGFMERGGEFASIFSLSPNSVYRKEAA